MKVIAVKGGSICRIGDYTLYEMPSNCVFNIGNTGVHTLYNMNRIEELVALSIRGKLTGALLLAGCGAEPQSPEAQGRARGARAGGAAEARDVGTLRDMVSDRYGDSNGRDKRAIEAMLRLHFLRNESVYLYTRVQSVTVPQPDRAQASVLVAMAGVPITSEVELSALRADLHRFDIDFALEDDSWRVQRATWSRAELGEIVGQ